tara:strand:- start:832 stop:1266 length:435 start_codon:yes stop_codon:yes gene_type:complete
MARSVLKHRNLKKKTFRGTPGSGYQAGKSSPGEKSSSKKDSDVVGKTSRLRSFTRGEQKEAVKTFKKMKDKNLAASSTKKTSKSKSNKTSTAQAGSNVSKSDGKKYNVGKSKGGVSFGEAFKHFRKKGVKAFTWNGKRYTTEVK